MDTKLLMKFENKWVALTHDRKKIIATATNLKTLDHKIKKLNKKDAIYHHVLPFKGSFSP